MTTNTTSLMSIIGSAASIVFNLISRKEAKRISEKVDDLLAQ